jgi:hypothetical protein
MPVAIAMTRPAAAQDFRPGMRSDRAPGARACKTCAASGTSRRDRRSLEETVGEHGEDWSQSFEVGATCEPRRVRRGSPVRRPERGRRDRRARVRAWRGRTAPDWTPRALPYGSPDPCGRASGRWPRRAPASARLQAMRARDERPPGRDARTPRRESGRDAPATREHGAVLPGRGSRRRGRPQHVTCRERVSETTSDKRNVCGVRETSTQDVRLSATHDVSLTDRTDS